MKLLALATIAYLAIVTAAPPPVPVAEPPKLIESDFQKQADGSYNFRYKLDNGNERYEYGTPKEVKDTEDENLTKVVIVVHGNYTQNDEEGKVHVFTYVADENGYQVEGDLLVKA